MSITTKTGDDGTTALLYSKRISKSHLRVVTYGQVDELSSALGLSRASSKDKTIKEQILNIQRQLIHLMGELATDDEDQANYHKTHGKNAISKQMVDQLTESIRLKETTLRVQGWECAGDTPQGWKCAGDTLADAFFDQARTMCRRAERGVVALQESGFAVRPELIQYLNRLADLLWLLSREHSQLG
ncbi:MAG: cob(I)alamin adenosyltransferase [Lentimonas sp.]|jgi:cob(I)alamin adenosyltransferase